MVLFFFGKELLFVCCVVIFEGGCGIDWYGVCFGCWVEIMFGVNGLCVEMC